MPGDVLSVFVLEAVPSSPPSRWESPAQGGAGPARGNTGSSGGAASQPAGPPDPRAHLSSASASPVLWRAIPALRVGTTGGNLLAESNLMGREIWKRNRPHWEAARSMHVGPASARYAGDKIRPPKVL